MERILMAAVILLVVFSCNDDPSFQDCLDSKSYVQQDSNYVSYAENAFAWDCKSISHYTVVLNLRSQACFGTDVRIEVVNNEIVSTTPLNDGTPLSLCKLFTIEMIYNKINESVDESIPIALPSFPEFDMNLASDYLIEYDTVLNYPTRVYIDYIFGISDEEFSIALSDLTILDD